jgi:hypothetical protein
MKVSKKNPHEDEVLRGIFENTGSREVIAARCGVCSQYLWEVLKGKKAKWRLEEFRVKSAEYLLELEEAKKRDRHKADEMMEKVRQLKADAAVMSGG